MLFRVSVVWATVLLVMAMLVVIDISVNVQDCWLCIP